jgi:hypothetical protein
MGMNESSRGERINESQIAIKRRKSAASQSVIQIPSTPTEKQPIPTELLVISNHRPLS